MGLKVALVHDWLVSQRGGEAVLETLVDFFRQLRFIPWSQIELRSPIS